MVAAVDLWIGMALLFTSTARESNAAYTVARSTLPLRLWGVLFVLLGVLVLVTKALWRTHCYRCFDVVAGITRIAGPGIYIFWAMTFFLAALTTESASFIAVAAYLYLAYRHSFSPVPGMMPG